MTRGPANRNWAEPRRFALLLAALVFIPFWDVLLGFDTWVIRDFALFSMPTANFQKECFWRGEWPLWDPYSLCGVPFLAQFNTLCVYPGALLYLLLPLTWALPAFCLLHVFWGGLGMYLLARRWTGSQAGAALAGVMFSFNGLSMSILMWPSHIATYSWIPWVIFLAQRGRQEGGRPLVLAALAGGMQVLGGGPETIAFTWVMAGIGVVLDCCQARGILWRSIWRFGLMGWLALMLAAAQLLPTIDFAMHSHRDAHFGRSDWSMPLWGWANLLVPMFQMIPMQSVVAQPDQYWTSSYYLGIGGIFLIGLALWQGRKNGLVRILSGMFFGSLILALGYNGYVFRWLQAALPILGMFQFPIKFVLLTSTVAPLLAAFGLAFCERDAVPKTWRGRWIWAAVLLSLIAFIIWAAWRWQMDYANWRQSLACGLERAGFLIAGVAVLYLFVRRVEWRWWSIVPLVALAWCDVLTHEPWQNPTVDPSLYQVGFGVLDAKFNIAPELSQSRLMMSPFSADHLYHQPDPDVKTNFLLDRAVFLADCNLLDDIPKVDGFFSLNIRESDKILWLLETRTGRKLDNLEDLLSVSQTIAPGKLFDWMLRTNYIPIASVGKSPVFAGPTNTFDAIDKDTADFHSVIYLPLEAKAVVKAVAEPRARIVSKDFKTSMETMEIDTPAPAIAGLTGCFYHNWEAAVDGKPVPIWRANYAFQAVEVPAGRHRLVLQYKDKAFRAGLVVSALALMACVAGWLAANRGRNASPRPPG